MTPSLAVLMVPHSEAVEDLPYIYGLGGRCMGRMSTSSKTLKKFFPLFSLPLYLLNPFTVSIKAWPPCGLQPVTGVFGTRKYMALEHSVTCFNFCCEIIQ